MTSWKPQCWIKYQSRKKGLASIVCLFSIPQGIKNFVLRAISMGEASAGPGWGSLWVLPQSVWALGWGYRVTEGTPHRIVKLVSFLSLSFFVYCLLVKRSHQGNWFIRTQSDGAINAVTHVYNPSARAVEERSQKLQVMLRLYSGFPVSDSWDLPLGKGRNHVLFLERTQQSDMDSG